ncbi:MAG: SAM-dependent methyltransferase [Lachnospiraceae bacterium]|nr:SAM-dependent methyltransferase [Lachnospiraceae bacterium]
MILAGYLQEIMDARPYKLVISKPVSKGQENKKINILLKKGYYQVERYTKTQVFHENLAFSRGVSRCIDFMPEEFLQMNAWSETCEFSILISRKGKVSWKKKNLQENSTKPQAQMEHNRKKQYILAEGEIIPPLVDMGIFTKDGRVAASMQDKFRQINRFVEIVDDAVKNLDRDCLKIVDFGYGKSYLTFILYYYFTQIRHIKVDMTGLDLKETVIDNCNRAAEKYGYTGLHFEMGDINGYKSEKPADMVITLHACDTATDYALFHAICWKAGMIFSVPCCQHELNKQFSSDNLSLLGRYGIVKERTAALMTDAIRANLLEYCGYKTQLMEFVDLENTPKNLLIRAVRHDASGKEQYLEEVENLMREFHFSPTLYRLLEAEGMLRGRSSRMRRRSQIESLNSETVDGETEFQKQEMVHSKLQDCAKE